MQILGYIIALALAILLASYAERAEAGPLNRVCRGPGCGAASEPESEAKVVRKVAVRPLRWMGRR